MNVNIMDTRGMGIDQGSMGVETANEMHYVLLEKIENVSFVLR